MEVADELDVSAVICIYNGQDALPAVFERLIAMKLNRFEAILVEDGSSDGYFDLLSDFRSRNPSVRVFRNDANLGYRRPATAGSQPRQDVSFGSRMSMTTGTSTSSMS